MSIRLPDVKCITWVGVTKTKNSFQSLKEESVGE